MSNTLKRRIFIAGAGSLLAMPFVSRSFAAETKDIYYNSTEKLDENSLPAKALKLALSKIDKGYQLKPSPVGYQSHTGLLNAFKTGGEIDVSWMGADKTIWDATLPVPMPIDAGLLGHRLLLIDGKRQAEFSSVGSLQELRRFIAIQGPGWGDIDILRNSGITVRTGLYKNLFRMTVGRRADFFPRAVYEAIDEQEQQVGDVPDLAVEQHLILKYRFAVMFFVSKKRPALQEDILAGLKAAHRDGSYQQMFNADRNVATALSKGNLGQRKIIEIENPHLPNDVNLIDEKYWLTV